MSATGAGEDDATPPVATGGVGRTVVAVGGRAAGLGSEACGFTVATGVLLAAGGTAIAGTVTTGAATAGDVLSDAAGEDGVTAAGLAAAIAGELAGRLNQNAVSAIDTTTSATPPTTMSNIERALFGWARFTMGPFASLPAAPSWRR